MKKVLLIFSLANAQTLTEKEQNNFEKLIEDKLYSCPRFSCQNDKFENLIYCHKNSIYDPFDVQLKDCNTFNLMSDSDFWGNHGPKKERFYCHH